MRWLCWLFALIPCVLQAEPEVSVKQIYQVQVETAPRENYQLEVSPDMETWAPLGATFQGNGETRSFYVDTDPAGTAFFRVSFETNGAVQVTPPVAIGNGAVVDRQAGTAVGNGASVLGASGTAIGEGATTQPNPDFIDNGDETVAVGRNALASGWRTTAIGEGAMAVGVSSTALGRRAYAEGSHMIALGRGAYSFYLGFGMELGERNVMVAGVDHIYLHQMAHRFFDPTGDTYDWPYADGGGTGRSWDVRTTLPRDTVIHGADAFDARAEQDPERFQPELYDPEDRSTWIHRMDENVPGGTLTIMGGRGTGTADGGSVDIRVAPAGTMSNNMKNSALVGLRVSTEFAQDSTTPVFIYFNLTKSLRQIEVGPNNSAGDGYRALRIKN